ncbi:helix-turn-helix domain-containing protein [Aquabacterium sp. J223]|uniref:helix-turn-helix domain-containing protein n=1 Tax=Aquabacterium sp. J223 TaxID=2898431 RepID=UPI0021AD5C17|nr:helix-turn-helix domain-containing protein [Aquabacterium sp. J223]UUX97586.1 helix-turn-helix domain-containing protein [Aquabacterium sp. J223]
MAPSNTAFDTSQVPLRERVGFWSDCVGRLFPGLRSDAYGDTEVDGRATTVLAGDVRLTRLEATRHHVTRSAQRLRDSERGYLKIVAPWVGCAGVQQKGREAWVTPDQWSLYDTTESYAVANPARVEHLIVMVPKDRLAERGLALDPLMARRLGGSGGIARVALDTMRTAYRELPGMHPQAALAVGDAITQFVHLAMLDLAGIGTAVTQREALRERIKQHVTEHLGDAHLTVDAIALAMNCSRRQLYNAFAEEPDGVAGYVLRRRLDACRQTLADRGQAHRSITDIAVAFGFSNMAHFSRAFRAHLGAAPSDYRRSALA